MKAVNIEWDTDGDKEIFDSLPQEIEIPEHMTDEDEISDYITGATGYCFYDYELR